MPAVRPLSSAPGIMGTAPCAGVGLMLVLWASPAAAQILQPQVPKPPPPPPPPPTSAQLEPVDATHPTASTALELARAYRREKRTIDALESYDRALARRPDRVVESNATKELLELRQDISTLEIFCEEIGTSLVVDGNQRGEPLPGKKFYVLPGPHEIVVAKPGKLPYRETIGATAGATINIDARLGDPGSVAAQGPPPKAFRLDRLGKVVVEEEAVTGPPSVPIYKRWWFWTVLGVAAAGTATYFVLTTEKDPYCGSVKPCATTIP